MLIIQEFWRNACVSTSYNSFNIDFCLTYHNDDDVRICFYVNTKLDVNRWSMNFSFDDVCTLRLRIVDDRVINIHNVYNSSLIFYISRVVLIVIETIKSKLNDEKEHVLLKDFNLHHSMWEKIFKSTQHDATNQLIDVVLQTRMQLTLSINTIIWKTRHSNSTIDLVFMIDWLVNNVINCETRFDLNQLSNHISILITLTLEVDSMSFKQKRTWKRINIDKLRKNLLLFVVSSCLINIEQMNVFANLIQSSIQRIIDATVSWIKFVSKFKSHWNQRCVDVVLTTRRKRRVWFAMRTEQTWHEYLKTTNEKKKIIARKKKIEFRQEFRFFIDTSFEFWRLIVWAKNKNHKSKEVFKIFALTRKNEFDVIHETIEDFLFKIEMLHQYFFSDTTKTNLNDLSKFNYRVFVEKSIINIQKTKLCKSSNVANRTMLQNLTTSQIKF